MVFRSYNRLLVLLRRFCSINVKFNLKRDNQQKPMQKLSLTWQFFMARPIEFRSWFPPYFSRHIFHNKTHSDPLQPDVLLRRSLIYKVLLVKQSELVWFAWLVKKFSFELQQIGSSLTIKLVDVAFLIVVSEVDDRHNAGIPEKLFEATLLYLSLSNKNFL